MNSKLLLYLVLGATAYSGFIYAHKQFDGRAKPQADMSLAVVDGSPFVQELMRVGVAGSAAVRGNLSRVTGAAALSALFPTTDEPWVERLRELEQEGVRPNSSLTGLHVAYPRGLQIEAPRFLQVNREGVGTAWVTVHETQGATEKTEIGAFELKVNLGQPFPADVKMQPGRTYELTLSHRKGGESNGREVFRVLKATERQAVKDKMPILRQHVGEAAQVLYMQICVSMSMGLHDNAATILDRLLRRLGNTSQLGIGVVERLLFIYDHRRGRVQAIEALARLKSLR